MKPVTRASTTYKTEVVFGIVCPLGTQYEKTLATLQSSLTRFGYSTNLIHISKAFPQLLRDMGGSPTAAPGDTSIAAKIAVGDAIRAKSGPDVLAAYAIASIARKRTSPLPSRRPEPEEKTAHVVLQLKRPEEVELLRRTYGHGFFLIGISSTHAERMRFFRDQGISEDKALGWIEADGDEKQESGQLTSKTFHLADVFISSDECEQQLPRFLDLVFSSPFTTPTRDERGMFMAFASSMSSGDLSRQVGAALLSEGGDVVAVGYNEVPRAGGGRYEGGPSSARDLELGEDANHRERARIVYRIIERFGLDRASAEAGLRECGVLGITEYGRAVHAEMDAILSCSRAGRSAVGANLYVTTFPCHNCARHILAAGIARVVFIEPYPQSKAAELHADAIRLDGARHSAPSDGGAIPFVPFIGIGPRRYVDLFSLKLGSGIQLERETDGKKRYWRPDLAGPRLPMLPSSYLEREQATANAFWLKLKRRKEPTTHARPRPPQSQTKR